MRERYNQRFNDLIEERGYSSYAEASLDPDFKRLTDNARYADVRERWEYESFFAQEGGEGARRTLGYFDDTGNDKLYDDGQFQALREGKRVQVDGDTLHGHHINDVSSGLEGNPTSIEHLLDPNNILLMTPKAHREYGHGGDTRFPTSGEAEEITQRVPLITRENREAIVNEPTFNNEIPFALGTALIAGSISAIIEVRRLCNDPRPWNQKTAIVVCSFALKGVQGGLISYAALRSRDAVTADSEILDVMEFSADSVNQLPLSIAEGIDADSLQNLLGGAVGLEVVVAIQAGMVVARGLRRGESLGDASKGVAQFVLVATGENLAFLLLGVALDSAIPDPTGIVIALRVVYSLGKAGVNHKKNKKSRIDCLNKRLELSYEFAVQQLRLPPPSR